MRVIAWSPHLTRERAEAAGAEFCASKEELFATSDIVSIHMVLSESTTGMIGAADLAKMKPTSFFINTSRGPLVDEAALINVLKEKRIAGAGLDVFDVEPLPLDHPLRNLSNVTITPHMGYVSDSNYEVNIFPFKSCNLRLKFPWQAFWDDTVDNIAAYLTGSPKRIMN